MAPADAGQVQRSQILRNPPASRNAPVYPGSLKRSRARHRSAVSPRCVSGKQASQGHRHKSWLPHPAVERRATAERRLTHSRHLLQSSLRGPHYWLRKTELRRKRWLTSKPAEAPNPPFRALRPFAVGQPIYRVHPVTREAGFQRLEISGRKRPRGIGPPFEGDPPAKD